MKLFVFSEEAPGNQEFPHWRHHWSNHHWHSTCSRSTNRLTSVLGNMPNQTPNLFFVQNIRKTKPQSSGWVGWKLDLHRSVVFQASCDNPSKLDGKRSISISKYVQFYCAETEIIQHFHTFHFNRHRTSRQRLQLLSKQTLNQQPEKTDSNTFSQQLLIQFYYKALACGILKTHQNYDHDYAEVNLLQVLISSLQPCWKGFLCITSCVFPFLGPWTIANGKQAGMRLTQIL